VNASPRLILGRVNASERKITFERLHHRVVVYGNKTVVLD
jgi:hypothetical protein